MKIVELRQNVASALEQWKKATEEWANATGDQRSAKKSIADQRKAEYDNLNEQLRNAEQLEAAEKAAADAAFESRQKPKESEEQKAARSFSFIRAISQISNNRQLDGVEKELYDEATKEAQRCGVSATGEIRLPAFMFEKRDQTVGTNTEGGHTVPTDLGSLIGVLRPRLALETLGATMLTGLTGNLDLPRQTSATSAAWEGEQTAADETSMAFDKVSLSPKRLAAFIEVSKKLMMQSSLSVESLVRQDLALAIANALESAALNGATGGNNPVGILQTSGIGSVAVGTNGGAPTWAHMISLWKEIAADNADMNTLAYLTTPGIAAQLMQTEKASSTGQFVWSTNNAAGQVNGYRAASSTLVPSGLTKGTSTDCHAILFGDFSSLIIANWAGVDITVDPYTRAKEATLVLTVNSWWDVGVRHPESFAVIKDARVTI